MLAIIALTNLQDPICLAYIRSISVFKENSVDLLQSKIQLE